MLGNLREIEGAVKSLLEGGQLPKLKEKISAINNRAVYEIPLILSRILNESRRGVRPELQATDV